LYETVDFTETVEIDESNCHIPGIHQHSRWIGFTKMEGSRLATWGIPIEQNQREKILADWTNKDMVRWFSSYTVECNVTLNGILASAVMRDYTTLDKLIKECNYTSEWDIWKLKEAFRDLTKLACDQKEKQAELRNAKLKAEKQAELRNAKLKAEEALCEDNNEEEDGKQNNGKAKRLRSTNK